MTGGRPSRGEGAGVRMGGWGRGDLPPLSEPVGVGPVRGARLAPSRLLCPPGPAWPK